MFDTGLVIAEWISGAGRRPPAFRAGTSGSPSRRGVASVHDGATGRTIVVDTDDAIPALVAAGLIDTGVALLYRGDSGTAAGVAGWRRTYLGTFTAAGSEVVVSDGFRLRQIRYGEAEFISFTVPTALLVTDEHDFSAFLRDADTAVAQGRFAEHLTDPLAVVANVASFGAPLDRAGPDRRIFVTADGSVSTSPFGAALGVADDGPTELLRRWRSGPAEGGDPIGLARTVPDPDRIEAIRERPWLPRYLEVVAVLQVIRSDRLNPGRVSGFGGRLTGGDQAAAGPDPLESTVLVQLPDAVWAVHPRSHHRFRLPDEQVRCAETELDRVEAVPSDRPPAGAWS